jgi:Ca2+-binding RTX toxin-like protein
MYFANIVNVGTFNLTSSIYGTAGADSLMDTAQSDQIYGFGGNDLIYVRQGNDTVDGGEGIDTVDYAFSDQIVGVDLASGFAISQGIDTLISIENANGGIGNDSFLGNAGANTLNGVRGNDRIDGREGHDLLIGHYDNDIIFGGSGNDVLRGQFNGGYDPYSGLDNDTLDGGIGNDTLDGGPGRDLLTGGADADTFVLYPMTLFNPVADDFDTIKDFQQGLDKIDVSAFDARPSVAGNQAFTFDSTPDGGWEEFWDGLSDAHLQPSWSDHQRRAG